MRIVITGGAGDVGVAATQLLAEDGHEITVVGRSRSRSIPNAAYAQCDVNDYEALARIAREHDVIVHLAALRAPVGYPGREVFRVNDLGTFNVFEAAANSGIKRVVAASSINALGTFFGDRSPRIEYLPVDESHPTLATDAYSFSKQVMEKIGRYFWERDGISSVMLRLPAVVSHETILSGTTPYRRYDPEIITRLLAMPDGERTRELARLQREYDAFRRTHRLEHLEWKDWFAAEESGLTLEELLFMHHKVNLFTYVDELDSAQSIARAVTADFTGSHPLFINSHRNGLGLPVRELAKLFSPDQPEIREEREGEDTIVSIDRARRLIGFAPQWTVPGWIGSGWVGAE